MRVDDALRADIGTLAAGLGVGNWDLALVGDGAGGNWNRPAGWACILIDRHGTGKTAGALDCRKLFTGGMNYGSIDFTELLTYVHAMLWYDRYHGRARRRQLHKPCLDVLVITDRDGIAKRGEALHKGAARADDVCRRCPLWAVVLQLERKGYNFTWCWQPRREVGLNALADRMADVAKHSAANALAQALDHARSRLLDPSDEELIYFFNSQLSVVMDDIKPARRKRYREKKQSPKGGFDPVEPGS